MRRSKALIVILELNGDPRIKMVSLFSLPTGVGLTLALVSRKMAGADPEGSCMGWVRIILAPASHSWHHSIRYIRYCKGILIQGIDETSDQPHKEFLRKSVVNLI